MATFTGTDANESITPTSVSSTVFTDPTGSLPGAGTDWLYGNGGNDTLDGGAGADSMYGGTGSDTYYVDNIGDYLEEVADYGDDSVLSSVDFILGNFIENLYLTGKEDIHASGNEISNNISGNTGDNYLYGAGGDDWIYGGDGADSLVDGDGQDYLDGGSGDDELFGVDNYWNWIGDSSKDTLAGGSGDDRYYLDSIEDVVLENFGEGIDTITVVFDYVADSPTSFVVSENVENLWLYQGGYSSVFGNNISNELHISIDSDSAGPGNASVYGLGGNDTIFAGWGEDTIDGGLGIDSMQGNLGDDYYYVDATSDKIVEVSDFYDAMNDQLWLGGNDTVFSTVSYIISTLVENLTLTGNAANATGNGLANSLTGNGSANTLSGLGGDDILSGGSGRDTLLGGDGSDTVLYTNATAAVKVDLPANLVTFPGQTTPSETLSSIENASTGSGADSLIGNTAANTLRAGAGNDTLTGGAGNDQLYGEAGTDRMSGEGGNDTYYVDLSTDLVIEATAGTAGGTDIVYTRASFTLGTNVEILRMIPGSGALNGTGNTLANELLGTSSANTLRGLGGVDTFDGGDGVDILIGGAGADVFKFSSTAGSNQAARDSIRSGDGAVAFEGAGSAAGDRFDLRTFDANTSLTGVQHFTFGTATGAGRLWAVNAGTDTLIRGNVDADTVVEFEVSIQDGSVLASAYTASDFLLA